MVQVGDLIFHRYDNHPSPAAMVTGYCTSPDFVRVKTPDGRHRIWHRRNFFKLNDEQSDDFASLFSQPKNEMTPHRRL
jgi:hypothetical protein